MSVKNMAAVCLGIFFSIALVGSQHVYGRYDVIMAVVAIFFGLAGSIAFWFSIDQLFRNWR